MMLLGVSGGIRLKGATADRVNDSVWKRSLHVLT